MVEVRNMEVCCTGSSEAEGGGWVEYSAYNRKGTGRSAEGIQTEQREKGYWVSKMFRLSLAAASFRKFQFTIQLVTIRAYTHLCSSWVSLASRLPAPVICFLRLLLRCTPSPPPCRAPTLN